jgi:hypothetical protein
MCVALTKKASEQRTCSACQCRCIVKTVFIIWSADWYHNYLDERQVYGDEDGGDQDGEHVVDQIFSDQSIPAKLYANRAEEDNMVPRSRYWISICYHLARHYFQDGDQTFRQVARDATTKFFNSKHKTVDRQLTAKGL